MYKIQDENARFTNRDEFERKKIAEKLYNLLKNNIQGLSPVMINGAWGAGKTEFCAKFINYIKDEEQNSTPNVIVPLYINAFQADHTDQAFMTIMGVLYSYLEENPEDQSVCKDLLKRATPIFKGLAKLGINEGAKLALNFAVGAVIPDNLKDATSELVKVALENSDNILDKELQEKFKSFAKLDETITAFKNTLKARAEKTPFIIFVDELDRCRPDFSVALLECIKHIFDIENVQFVLVCNSMQLTASIKHRYGASIDAENYLEKFFGFKVNLINNEVLSVDYKKEQRINRELKYLRKLIDKSILGEELYNYLNDILFHGRNQYLILTIFIFPLSLRLREKFFTNFRIYWNLKEITPNSLSFSDQFNLFFGVYIHTINQDVSSNLLLNKASCMELARLLAIEDTWQTFEDHINKKLESNLPFKSDKLVDFMIRFLIQILFDESYPKYDSSVAEYIRNVEHFEGNSFPDEYYHYRIMAPTKYKDLINTIGIFNLSA